MSITSKADTIGHRGTPYTSASAMPGVCPATPTTHPAHARQDPPVCDRSALKAAQAKPSNGTPPACCLYPLTRPATVSHRPRLSRANLVAATPSTRARGFAPAYGGPTGATARSLWRPPPEPLLRSRYAALDRLRAVKVRPRIG